MMPKKPARDSIRGVRRFSDYIMLQRPSLGMLALRD